MKKARIALVGMCSHFEYGWERYEELIDAATDALIAAGLDVVIASKPCYTQLEALEIIDEFKAADVDALAVMYVTWVADSQAYLFVNELSIPSVHWAVPYTETFSIGCVTEFVQALTMNGIPFEYVYGLPSDTALVERIRKVAVAGQIVKKISKMRVALVGPRQTWRVAGPQDMSMEEWQFSRYFGTTIVHMEIEEITNEAKRIDDAEAEAALEKLKSRTGKDLVGHDVMLWMAKVYLQTKKVLDQGGIDCIAAECYPMFGGLMNQTSSWLEDEGYIVDTEGDIAHAITKYMLRMASGGKCAALGEIGSFNEEAGYCEIAHEGSSPASLAESTESIQISPLADGCFVGFPLKPMEHCVACDFQGSDGKYQMFLAPGSVLPATHEEWVSGGEKLLIKLSVDDVKPSTVIKTMIDNGFHHHIVVTEGELCEQIALACKFLGVNVIMP